MNKLTAQEKTLLWLVALLCLGLITGSYFWSNNRFYTNAYSPVVEKSIEVRKEQEKIRREKAGESTSDSEEPQAKGLREREIEKQQGDRFSTY